MKTEKQIVNRLQKLRGRYERQYLKKSQDRLHRNCDYNYEEPASRFPNGEPYQIESKMNMIVGSNDPDKTSPERLVRESNVVSLIVLEEESKRRFCLYGSENPAEWAGELCNNDSKARTCKWFKPKQSKDEAINEFRDLLEDDKYVYDNYKDIAALQWALDVRIHDHRRSLFQEFLTYLIKLFTVFTIFKKPKPLDDSSELEGIWEDDTSSHS